MLFSNFKINFKSIIYLYKCDKSCATCNTKKHIIFYLYKKKAQIVPNILV